MFAIRNIADVQLDHIVVACSIGIRRLHIAAASELWRAPSQPSPEQPTVIAPPNSDAVAGCWKFLVYRSTVIVTLGQKGPNNKQAGYPERFAQETLGHNSKAVHRAYARKAQVKVPSLEEYEKNDADRKPTNF